MGWAKINLMMRQMQARVRFFYDNYEKFGVKNRFILSNFASVISVQTCYLAICEICQIPNKNENEKKSFSRIACGHDVRECNHTIQDVRAVPD